MPCLLVRAALLCLTLVSAFTGVHCLAAETLERRSWTVDGVTREALVHLPATVGDATKASPLVFAFHGHGGSMRQASRSFPIHEAWPEAIVIYPQGLPTPSALVDREGTRSGWQSAAGEQGDRDLKFFDVMLADLQKQYRVDPQRIYATGHSNGGLFTYLLWAERGDLFAAFAPSSALLTHGFSKARPKPVLHIGSPQDPLVKFAWQERMIDTVLKLNGCGPRKTDATGYTLYPSSRHAEVATYLHDGGHRFPKEATRLITGFFKANVRQAN